MNLRSFSLPPFSSSEKPPRYVRKGEGRRRLSWSFLGLALGVVFGLLLTSQTRHVMLSEAATLLPPGNPITRLVDSGVSIRAVPDAMEQFANARRLPTGRYDTAKNAPLFPQEIELVRIAALYPNHADVQAGFLSAMTEFRVRTDSLRVPAPEKPFVAPARIPLDPTLLRAINHSLENGENSEPHNGFFPLMKALVELTQHRYNEGFVAIHRAALCSEWNSHTNEQSQGELEAIQRRKGMVTPYELLMYGKNHYYSGSYRSSMVVSIIRAHAGRYEATGRVKEGFALRMNLVAIGLKMAYSASEAATASSPRTFLLMALTQPAGKEWVARKNSPSENWKSTMLARIGDYTDFLQAKGFAREQRIVEDLTRTQPLSTDYDRMFDGMDGFEALMLHGVGVVTLAGLFLVLLVVGGTSLSLHQRRFGDYRLPPITPFLTGGIWLGILLCSFSLLAICFSETPILISFLIAALTGFVLFLPLLTRSNPDLTQMLRVAGKIVASCAGIFVLCLGLFFVISLWSGNAEFIPVDENVTMMTVNVVPLPAIAVATGVIMGFFALLFLFCSIYARIKRQPMASGGLLHFQAIGVPFVSLVLLGYATSVVYTAERYERSGKMMQTVLSTKGD